ncbi:hypothetical protein D3C87_2051170 [compost metagenome]
MKSCEAATPARMVRSAPPRVPLERRATKKKAANAPTKAPADSETAPAPIPRMTTATAPVDAPAEIPKT